MIFISNKCDHYINLFNNCYNITCCVDETTDGPSVMKRHRTTYIIERFDGIKTKIAVDNKHFHRSVRMIIPRNRPLYYIN